MKNELNSIKDLHYFRTSYPLEDFIRLEKSFKENIWQEHMLVRDQKQIFAFDLHLSPKKFSNLFKNLWFLLHIRCPRIFDRIRRMFRRGKSFARNTQES